MPVGTASEFIVLRDVDTNRYYSGKYMELWTKDIKEARSFANKIKAASCMAEFPDDFEEVENIEVVTLWATPKKIGS
jgi:hypothetical protein